VCLRAPRPIYFFAAGSPFIPESSTEFGDAKGVPAKQARLPSLSFYPKATLCPIPTLGTPRPKPEFKSRPEATPREVRWLILEKLELSGSPEVAVLLSALYSEQTILLQDVGGELIAVDAAGVQTDQIRAFRGMFFDDQAAGGVVTEDQG
jgi:hypothetical protein